MASQGRHGATYTLQEELLYIKLEEAQVQGKMLVTKYSIHYYCTVKIQANHYNTVQYCTIYQINQIANTRIYLTGATD